MVFYYSFCDYDYVCSGGMVSLWWRVSGEYTVNVTAVTRSNSQTYTTQVRIQSVDEGSSPFGLAVKADWNQADDFAVTTYVEVTKQETHQLIGSGETPRHSTWKSMRI